MSAYLPPVEVSIQPLTAEQCRERARELFAQAVAEDDLMKREALLIRGERWMSYWRFWSPDTYIAYEP